LTQKTAIFKPELPNNFSKLVYFVIFKRLYFNRTEDHATVYYCSIASRISSEWVLIPNELTEGWEEMEWSLKKKRTYISRNIWYNLEGSWYRKQSGATERI